MEYTANKYGYRTEHKQPFHLQKMSEEEFKMLAPLLEEQPYITRVISTEEHEPKVDYDLDKFRGVLWRSFTGNYVEAYYKTFNVPYTAQDLISPWLIAQPKFIAPIIIARTFRYRNPSSVIRWKQFVAMDNFDTLSVFVGHNDEYEDFKKTFNTTLPHYKPKDFLELSQAISAADHIISNQTFVYTLAQGLGKPLSLEINPDRPLASSEVFFNRPDCFYF